MTEKRRDGGYMSSRSALAIAGTSLALLVVVLLPTSKSEIRCVEERCFTTSTKNAWGRILDKANPYLVSLPLSAMGIALDVGLHHRRTRTRWRMEAGGWIALGAFLGIAGVLLWIARGRPEYYNPAPPTEEPDP